MSGIMAMRKNYYNSTLLFQCDKNVDPTTVGAMRTKQDSLSMINQIKSARSNTRQNQLRTEHGLRETENPLFELNIDLYKYGINDW